MNDTTPSKRSDDPSTAPFGAGIPAQVVEPVRLAPGLAHGPALDVRGHVAPSPPPPVAPHAYFHAQANASSPSGQPTNPEAAATFGAGTASSASSSAPPGPTPGSATPPPPPSSSSAAVPAQKPRGRWWIGIAHLLFLAPFPFGVIPTAVLWIWRRAHDPLMADQGREALNMQLTFWLAIGLLGLTCFVSPLVPFVYVLGAVLCILAAISAVSGERHRYPWVFRFLT